MVAARILPVFGQMPIVDVRKADVERWLIDLADRKYAVKTGRVLLTHLRSIFNEALDNGLLDRNPAARVKLPEMKPAAEPQPYTDAEVRFLASQPAPDGLLLRVMLFTGLRPGEALALVPGDVAGNLLIVARSLDNGGHVKAPKTGKTRPVSLPPVLAGDLAALAEATPAGERLFGAWHSVAYLQEALRRRLGAIVPGFSLRRCRTTFATNFRGDPADVQALLGHSKLAMTMDNYRRAVPGRMAEAVAELEKRAMEKGVVQ